MRVHERVCVRVCLSVIWCWHAFVSGVLWEQINRSPMKTLFSTQWGDSCIYKISLCKWQASPRLSSQRTAVQWFMSPKLSVSTPTIVWAAVRPKPDFSWMSSCSLPLDMSCIEKCWPAAFLVHWSAGQFATVIYGTSMVMYADMRTDNRLLPRCH